MSCSGLYIYIYIYIERERGRGRERKRKKERFYFNFFFFFFFFSEPLFIKANIIINNKNNIIFHIYQPSGVLPPLLGDGCQSYVDTYGLFLYIYIYIYIISI